MQTLIRGIERLWDDVATALYERGDAGPAAAVLADDVVWTDLPAGTGGSGRDAVAGYLGDLAGRLPGRAVRTRVSRTVDVRRLVDEVRFSFVHDRALPWLLPGVPATGRAVEVLAVQIVRVRQGRIDSARTLWDAAGLRAALDRAPEPGADPAASR